MADSQHRWRAISPDSISKTTSWAVSSSVAVPTTLPRSSTQNAANGTYSADMTYSESHSSAFLFSSLNLLVISGVVGGAAFGRCGGIELGCS